jgi:hypothetical protein
MFHPRRDIGGAGGESPRSHCRLVAGSRAGSRRVLRAGSGSGRMKAVPGKRMANLREATELYLEEVPDEIKNTRGLDLFRTFACPSCRLLAGRNAARRWSGWVSRKPASAAVTWSCAAPSRGPARMSGADFRHAAGVRSNKPKRRRRLITHVGEGRLRSMSKDSRHKTAMKMQRAHALFSCVLRLQVSRLSHKSKNRFAFSRKLSCIGEL